MDHGAYDYITLTQRIAKIGTLVYVSRWPYQSCYFLGIAALMQCNWIFCCNLACNTSLLGFAVNRCFVLLGNNLHFIAFFLSIVTSPNQICQQIQSLNTFDLMFPSSENKKIHIIQKFLKFCLVDRKKKRSKQESWAGLEPKIPCVGV